MDIEVEPLNQEQEPLDAAIMRDLNDGRRPKQQIRALETIAKWPHGFLYNEEVYLLTTHTKNKLVHEAAMKTLWGLDPSLYAESQKQFPWGDRFGKLDGSRRVFTPRSING
jgi:hypothetical protein